MITTGEMGAVRRKQLCSCLSRQFGACLEKHVYTRVTSIRTAGSFTTSRSGRCVTHNIRTHFFFYNYESDVFLNKHCYVFERTEYITEQEKD
jgi:hypothetical protein